MSGKIYGGTGNIGHLFVYNPATGVSTDLGQAVPEIDNVSALTVCGGKIYGGAGEYGTSAHLFVHNPNTGVRTDLGIAVPGEYYINALTCLGGKVYGGTGWDGYLFVYDPGTGVLTGKGAGAPGGEVEALVAGPDGKIYGGSDGGYLFTYNPAASSYANLGRPIPAEYSVLSLVFGSDGKLYGGTGYDNGHLFVYDPSTATVTDKGRAVWGSNYVYDLVRGNDNRIYGGGTQFFVYNPTDHPYRSPGWATSTDIIPAIRSATSVPSTYEVYALTQGSDGKIYAGGGYGARLAVYDPSSGAITDLGQAVAGEYYIYSLTTGKDGRIYGGTYGGNDTSGRLFVYNPSNGVITDLGQAVSGERGIYALTTGKNGKIYGGTYGWEATSGHFFVYNPSTGVMADKGQAVPGETGVYALTTAQNGKIYGGTAWDGHLFVYNPATGALVDKGVGAPGDWEILSLVTASDGSIYGGGWDGYLFRYIPSSNTFVNLGEPVVSGYDMRALTFTGGVVYGISHRYGSGRRHPELFAYDTGGGTSQVVGQPIASEEYVYSLESGGDGRVYGGTGWDYGYLFCYDPHYVFEWGGISFSTSAPAGTSTRVHVLSQDGYALLTDVSNGQSLASLDSTAHPGIKLQAELQTSIGATTPHLFDWSVAWPSMQLSSRQIAIMLAPSEPDVAVRQVQIDKVSDSAMSWTVSDDQSWLGYSPAGGTAPGTLTITVDKSGLAQDTWHTGHITLDWSSGFVNGSEEITVMLYVGEHRNVFLPLIGKNH